MKNARYVEKSGQMRQDFAEAVEQTGGWKYCSARYSADDGKEEQRKKQEPVKPSVKKR